LRLTVSKENYLKAIAEAEAEGEVVISATLARWLNVSPPAVTMATRRLCRDGLIRVRHGKISLTEPGREAADRVLQRHHLIERMLAEIFGMEWYKIHDEAEQLEHAVSAEFESLLRARLGDHPVCPHGNGTLQSPSQRRQMGWMPLPEMPFGRLAAVQCVFERDRGLLEYLESLKVRPGTRFEVAGRTSESSLLLSVADAEVQIRADAAAKVWVSEVATIPSEQI
jgi:DtxR family Mn-dependent transcriptional regulator